MAWMRHNAMRLDTLQCNEMLCDTGRVECQTFYLQSSNKRVNETNLSFLQPVKRIHTHTHTHICTYTRTYMYARTHEGKRVRYLERAVLTWRVRRGRSRRGGGGLHLGSPPLPSTLLPMCPEPLGQGTRSQRGKSG